MRCFPMRFLQSVKRGRHPRLLEYSEEELDEQGMRDLEATIAEGSGFIVLKGEKLHKYEKRLAELAEVFKKTAIVPVDTPVPLESTRRTNIPALMRSRPDVSGAGPSGRSMDFTHDQPLKLPNERDSTYLTASSRSSSIRGPENEDEGDIEESPHAQAFVAIPSHDSGERTQEEVEAEKQQEEVVDNGTQSAAALPAVAAPSAEETDQTSPRRPPVDVSHMYSMEQHQKMQGLDSEASGDEEIPAASLLNSVYEDSVLPDTATTVDAVTLSDMNDWNRYRPLTSFSDFNTPLPMKVHGFIDLQTQSVASSKREDEVDRSLQPRTPEKDHSTTDGLLFSIDSFDMPLRRSSQRASSALTSSPESDLDGEETVLSRLTEQAMIRARHFRASRMSVMPNFPVNVWDDVAPTRLHAQLVDVSMDQDYKLLSAMH